MEDEPPPRSKGPKATPQVYSEEKLTKEEMASGMRAPDLAASITKGIRKARVVAEEAKAGEPSEEEEEELSDPMEVESEET